MVEAQRTYVKHRKELAALALVATGGMTGEAAVDLTLDSYRQISSRGEVPAYVYYVVALACESVGLDSAFMEAVVLGMAIGGNTPEWVRLLSRHFWRKNDRALAVRLRVSASKGGSSARIGRLRDWEMEALMAEEVERTLASIRYIIDPRPPPRRVTYSRFRFPWSK